MFWKGFSPLSPYKSIYSTKIGQNFRKYSCLKWDFGLLVGVLVDGKLVQKNVLPYRDVVGFSNPGVLAVMQWT